MFLTALFAFGPEYPLLAPGLPFGSAEYGVMISGREWDFYAVQEAIPCYAGRRGPEQEHSYGMGVKYVEWVFYSEAPPHVACGWRAGIEVPSWPLILLSGAGIWLFFWKARTERRKGRVGGGFEVGVTG